MLKGKRRTAAVFILLLMAFITAALGVGVGTAYLSDKDMRQNTIYPGDSNLEITEEFPPPGEITPGKVMQKSVQITNKGKSSCFVRVRLLFDNEDIMPYVTCRLDTEHWEKGSDGYYYYRYALPKGAVSTELLRDITVSENIPGDLADKGFSLTVYAESYQQGEFSDSAWKEAWQHFDRNKKGGGQNT